MKLQNCPRLEIALRSSSFSIAPSLRQDSVAPPLWQAEDSFTPPLRQAPLPSASPSSFPVGCLRRSNREPDPLFGRSSPPRSEAPSPVVAFPHRLPAPFPRILPRWPQIPRRPPPSTPIESSRSAVGYSFLLLFLGGDVWIDRKVYVVHEVLDHVHGVGAPGLRIDSLLHDDGGDVPELHGQLRTPLLARNLELPFLQNLTEHNNLTEQHNHGWFPKVNPKKANSQSHLFPRTEKGEP